MDLRESNKGHVTHEVHETNVSRAWHVTHLNRPDSLSDAPLPYAAIPDDYHVCSVKILQGIIPGFRSLTFPFLSLSYRQNALTKQLHTFLFS